MYVAVARVIISVATGITCILIPTHRPSRILRVTKAPGDADYFGQITNQVNPDARVIRVSMTRGDNLEDLYGWLLQRRALRW